VQFADWAAPIVPVLKADGKCLRICGDFKVTVNKASKLDRYPIPKIEDLFATLSHGTSFSKLDMSQAYQQIMLDDDSKNYVVINTHRGLFCYNQLPLFWYLICARNIPCYGMPSQRNPWCSRIP